MTPERIHDLCLVQTLRCRAELNAARVGYPSHTAPERVAHNEQLLKVWSEIDRIREWTALPSEWRQLLSEAAR